MRVDYNDDDDGDDDDDTSVTNEARIVKTISTVYQYQAHACTRLFVLCAFDNMYFIYLFILMGSRAQYVCAYNQYENKSLF